LQLYVERQKLSLKGEAKALDDDAVLAAAGVRDGSELEVKDLGPQVSWRTVFLVEYVRLFSLPSPSSTTKKQNDIRLAHLSSIRFCTFFQARFTGAMYNTVNCKSMRTRWSWRILRNASSRRFCALGSFWAGLFWSG